MVNISAEKRMYSHSFAVSNLQFPMGISKNFLEKSTTRQKMGSYRSTFLMAYLINFWFCAQSVNLVAKMIIAKRILFQKTIWKSKTCF
jgi:hypothetical protein